MSRLSIDPIMDPSPNSIKGALCSRNPKEYTSSEIRAQVLGSEALLN